MLPEDHKYPGSSIDPKKLSNFSTGLFYFSILFFIIGFNFTDRMAGNWYQQFLPDIGNRQISDIFFLDSLTGWSVTNATNQANDTTFVLKTTSGGDSWVIQYRKVQTGGGFLGYFRVYFLNQNTGYTCGVTGIEKTINGGNNWTSLNAPLNSYLDMSILSIDTVWIVSSNPFTGGVFRTTNGGAFWENKGSFGSSNPSHIYMYNERIGFIDGLKRTTDAGQTWTTIAGEPSLFFDMYFADSLTGWKTIGTSFQKTLNGGLNWTSYSLPLEQGNILISRVNKFENMIKDTIWGVGSTGITASGNRGLIYRSTNSGSTWGYQIPDSVNINIFAYQHIDFINQLTGWAYTGARGIHTTNGGDTTLLGAVQLSTNIPIEYYLYQNYPNPFNPSTKIRFHVSKLSEVKIAVYDIRGREITVLINEKLLPGEYETVFSPVGLSSGTYFYSLKINNATVETRKMIYLK